MKFKFYLYIFCLSVLGNNLYAQVESNENDSKTLSLLDFSKKLFQQRDICLYFDNELKNEEFNGQNLLTESIEEIAYQLSLKLNINFQLYDDYTIIATESFGFVEELSGKFYRGNKTKSNEDVASESFSRILDASLQKAEEESLSIGIRSNNQNEKVQLSGKIRDKELDEPIFEASLFAVGYEKDAVVSDFEGNYVLELWPGEYIIKVIYLGKSDWTQRVKINGSGELNIELSDAAHLLEEVVVTETRDVVNDMQIGTNTISTDQIEKLPSLLGEADVQKITLYLPGVQTTGEAATGFNVRGGTVDQNLMLLDGVPIYRPDHLFGVFSAYNSNMVESATLYKGGINARFGGRVSSIFDVEMRNGEDTHYKLNGAISPITANVVAEGPIQKGKSSAIVGYRGSYSDWLLDLLDDTELDGSSGSFYDLTTKVNFKLKDNQNLSVTYYTSNDDFRFSSDTLFNYTNDAATLSYNRGVSKDYWLTTRLSYSKYGFSLEDNRNEETASRTALDIEQYSAAAYLGQINSKSSTQTNFGLESTYYINSPGSKSALSSNSEVQPIDLKEERGLETSVFGDIEMNLSPFFKAKLGLRLNMFNVLGPAEVTSYEANSARSESSALSTTNFDKNEVIKTYFGPEVRVSGRYLLNESTSVKLAYDRLYQYIHLLSNSVSVAPTDGWRLSSEYIEPQLGNQISAGIFKELKENQYDVSIEGYYKRVTNQWDYRDGAELLLNEFIERDVVPARLDAYGAELLINKNRGQLTGWISYTYSRSKMNTSHLPDYDQVNDGLEYPANQDRPHAVSLVTNYDINKRWSLSMTSSFLSGRPTSVPVVRYSTRGIPTILYTTRNGYRIPNYFRTDLTINYGKTHHISKKWRGSWALSVYNLTSRFNVQSVYFRNENDFVQGYKLSIFRYAIPTLIYKFEIQ